MIEQHWIQPASVVRAPSYHTHIHTHSTNWPHPQNIQLAWYRWTRRTNASLQIKLPKGLPAAWFPGRPLPVPVRLQFVVDGYEWGARFDTAIGTGSIPRVGQGVAQRAAPLVGCRVIGWRRGPGPSDLDALVTTEAQPGDARWSTVRGMRRACALTCIYMYVQAVNPGHSFQPVRTLQASTCRIGNAWCALLTSRPTCCSPHDLEPRPSL